MKFKEGAELSAKQQELRTKVKNGDASSVVLALAIEQAEKAALSAQTSLDYAQREEASALEAWNTAGIASALGGERLLRLLETERMVSSMPTRDLADLQSRLGDLQKAALERTLARDARKKELSDLQRRIAKLQAGLPVYPERVQATLDALEGAGIVYRVLCREIVDVDHDVARSVEAALGDARFALLVSKGANERAFEIAKSKGFPGPVYSGPFSTHNETAGPAKLGVGAPKWLARFLRGPAFGTDGTFRDDRGSWVGIVEGHFLGARAIQEALQEAESVLPSQSEQMEQAESALAIAKKQGDECYRYVEAERDRRRLLQETVGLPDAKTEAAALQISLAKATEVKDKSIAERERASNVFAVAKSGLGSARTDKSSHDKQLGGEREALRSADDRAAAIEEERTVLRQSIPPDLRQEAEAGQLSGPDTVAADLKLAQKRLNDAPTPPPPEVRLEAKNLETNVEELESHVRQRKADADAADAELAECRGRYLEVVNFTLLEYKRRAIELGRSAAVDVEMELPALRDDERALDEATIMASFGFDGKEVAPMGDSTFSGGQQVVAGLILLMAMAETDGHGFFMLDEPFAHLSVDRVEEVGQFLRGSRAQFLITAPTLLDRAQLDPASMVIVLQKKRKDAQYAPAPVVAIA